MDALCPPNQQLRTSPQAENLHLLRAKSETPTSEIHRGNDVTALISVQLCRPFVDGPVVPIERKTVNRYCIYLTTERPAA